MSGTKTDKVGSDIYLIPFVSTLPVIAPQTS